MADRKSDSNNRTTESNALYVGHGVTVKGDIVAPHLVLVDGTIEGSVTARAVVVGASGAIKGTVSATEAEVHGIISENIDVKQLLIIHVSGRVSGNVNYGELLLEQGAIISGTISSVDTRSDQSGPKLESVLAKCERPVSRQQIESMHSLNVGLSNERLPAPEFQSAK